MRPIVALATLMGSWVLPALASQTPIWNDFDRWIARVEPTLNFSDRTALLPKGNCTDVLATQPLYEIEQITHRPIQGYLGDGQPDLINPFTDTPTLAVPSTAQILRIQVQRNGNELKVLRQQRTQKDGRKYSMSVTLPTLWQTLAPIYYFKRKLSKPSILNLIREDFDLPLTRTRRIQITQIERDGSRSLIAYLQIYDASEVGRTSSDEDILLDSDYAPPDGAFFLSPMERLIRSLGVMGADSFFKRHRRRWERLKEPGRYYLSPLHADVGQFCLSHFLPELISQRGTVWSYTVVSGTQMWKRGPGLKVEQTAFAPALNAQLFFSALDAGAFLKNSAEMGRKTGLRWRD